MTFTAIYNHSPKACGVCNLTKKDSYTTYISTDKLVYICSQECFRIFNANYSRKYAVIMSHL